MTQGSKQKQSRKIRNGFIFLANHRTEQEVFDRQLFGLPNSPENYERLKQLGGDSVLFLFNLTTRVLYGMYKPNGPPSYNIAQDAWSGKFPLQLRFTCLAEQWVLVEDELPEFLKKTSNRCMLLSGAQARSLMQAQKKEDQPNLASTMVYPGVFRGTPSHQTYYSPYAAPPVSAPQPPQKMPASVGPTQKMQGYSPPAGANCWLTPTIQKPANSTNVATPPGIPVPPGSVPQGMFYGRPDVPPGLGNYPTPYMTGDGTVPPGGPMPNVYAPMDYGYGAQANMGSQSSWMHLASPPVAMKPTTGAPIFLPTSVSVESATSSGPGNSQQGSPASHKDGKKKGLTGSPSDGKKTGKVQEARKPGKRIPITPTKYKTKEEEAAAAEKRIKEMNQLLSWPGGMHPVVVGDTPESPSASHSPASSFDSRTSSLTNSSLTKFEVSEGSPSDE